MLRLIACFFTLMSFAASAKSAEPTPEELLPLTTQLYARWDGIAKHNAAYRASVWGGVMDGPTGDSIRAVIAKAPKLLGSNLLAKPLLDGKSPGELRSVHGDLKNAEHLIDLIAANGVVVGAEVGGPAPTLEGLGNAFERLTSGKNLPPDTFLPQGRMIIIIPDVGERSEILFSSIRLALREQAPELIQKLPEATGRKGYFAKPKSNEPLHSGWWMEGKHFVLYVGTDSVEAAIKSLSANAERGGLTDHPLFNHCNKCGPDLGFNSVTRGFVDTDKVIGLVRRLGGPFVPGLTQRFDDLGLNNFQSIVFNSGFDGKNSRAVYEIALKGERKGLAKIIKPLPLTLNDLPPMPPDVTRFSALRLDLPAIYDLGLGVVEAGLATRGNKLGIDKAKNSADEIRLRKKYLNREVTKFAGIPVKEELLPYLGDKVVQFQSPVEGLNVFGTVVAISCKDPAKVEAIVDQLQQGLVANLGLVKVRKKMLLGVGIREIYGRDFGFATPTYAVVGDWLVFALHPQLVQGIILRSKGELPKWKPDAATSARLATLPTDAVGIQFCDPKSTVTNLCCVGPLFLSLVANINFGQRSNEDEFEPLEVGYIPNGHELSRHLFPNLTVTTDTGRSIRIETNESFSLPAEFMGFEMFTFFALTRAFN
jgi:hypothetical protein